METPVSLDTFDSASSPATSASVTPTAGPVFVGANIDMGGTQTSTPVVAGCGLTWSLVKEQQQAFGVSQYIYLWKGVGTPSTGTVTITVDASDTASEINAVLFEVQDANPTLVQAAVSVANYASGAQSVNFGSTTGSSNTVITVVGQLETQTAITPATGFTRLASSARSGGTDIVEVHYVEASAETAAGGSFTNNYFIIGAELEATAAASVSRQNTILRGVAQGVMRGAR